MRDDLKGLEISRQELQRLTNLPVNEELVILIQPIKRLLREYIRKIKGPEGASVFFIGFSTLFITYIIFDIFIKTFTSWAIVPSWLLLAILSFFGGLVGQGILFLQWRRKHKFLSLNITHSLEVLLSDVDRYNSVIKAIDINDQLEAVGNPSVRIKERDKVIAALELTRLDLVRALKTERILRENKNFIISNTELFTNNLANLTALQVSEQASEHGRLLNEALQIALDVQHEMRRLQSQY